MADAFQVTLGTEYARADVLVVGRTWRPGITLELAERLVDQARRDKVCLIYSIDDNLLDLRSVPDDVRMIVRHFCREADGILVSTGFLKERLGQINRRICVVPNAIDERLFKSNGDRLTPRKVVGDRKIIGYMGTYTHDADLMMVLQALRTILRKFLGSIELQLVGGLSNSTFINALQGLPVKVLHVPVEDVEYPRFVSWMKNNLHWHLAIAPLEDTYFSRSKSDIKFLDYSALGISGIYSRVPAYEETVRHLETGYLVENTPTAWIEALERILVDDLLREELAKVAQEYVFSTRTLEYCSATWQDAILSIVKVR